MTMRRDFLAFTAGAVAAKTVLPAVARADQPSSAGKLHSLPDAEMLRAVHTWRDADGAVKAYETSHSVEDHDDDEFDVLCDAEGEALDVVGATRATTIAGMQVKASVLQALLYRFHEEAIEQDSMPAEIELALSLCRDMLGVEST